MTLLKIARMGHPVLHQRAEELSEEEIQCPEIQRLIDDMIETMEDADGVGIAAPQVFVSKRLFIASLPPDNDRYDLVGEADVPPTAFLNPTFVEHSKATEEGFEGCLSIPSIRGLVPRWTELRMEALDRHGKPLSIKADGFFARVLQHEMDHLDGILFPERIEDMRTLSFEEEFDRYVMADLQQRT